MLHKKEWQDWLFIFSCFLMIPAFIYSKALITGCIVIFTLLAIRHFIYNQEQEYKYHESLWFILVFLVTFISFWNHDSENFTWRYIILKLPFLILPLAFWVLPSIQKRMVIYLHLWLLGVISMGAIPQFFIILNDYDEMIRRIGVGQAIPTPVEHVKFSMFNAYAVVTGIIIFLYEKSQYPRQLKWCIILAIVIVTVYMHVLGVRTGLVILYTSILGLIVYNSWKLKSVKGLLLPLAGLIGFVGLAITSISSLRQKVRYMMYDWKMYLNGTGEQFADSRRMLSAEEALTIWRDDPIWGVGFHQIRSMCCLAEDGNMSILPHNQFLLFLVSTGIIGLILFLIGFYFPLLVSKSRRNLLLIALYVNFTISFLVENSLERSFSLSFFLFFALLLIHTSSEGTHEGTVAHH